MAPLLDNEAPVVHRARTSSRRPASSAPPADPSAREPIDSAEVFDHLREISDPEHPYTLEQVRRRAWRTARPRSRARPARLRSHFPSPAQLNVLTEERVSVDDAGGRVECAAPPRARRAAPLALTTRSPECSSRPP